MIPRSLFEKAYEIKPRLLLKRDLSKKIKAFLIFFEEEMST